MIIVDVTDGKAPSWKVTSIYIQRGWTLPRSDIETCK
jgi:hypothetical protein